MGKTTTQYSRSELRRRIADQTKLPGMRTFILKKKKNKGEGKMIYP